MKMSELIDLMLMAIDDVGDRDLAIVRQTGPDSWNVAPVVRLATGHFDDNKPCVVIE